MSNIDKIQKLYQSFLNKIKTIALRIRTFFKKAFQLFSMPPCTEEIQVALEDLPPPTHVPSTFTPPAPGEAIPPRLAGMLQEYADQGIEELSTEQAMDLAARYFNLGPA
jgi:hypothetical protein